MNQALRVSHPATTPLPFDIDFDALSLPVAGQPSVIRDIPLFTPIDHKIDAALVLTRNGAVAGPGVIQAHLVQDRGSLGVFNVSRNVAVLRSGQVSRIEPSAVLTALHPVYLRLRASISVDASTPWWVGASAAGTVHFTVELQK
jgi:hypothetical protein